MKTLYLVTVILLQILHSVTMVARAAEEGKANRQTPEHKYAEPSPIPDYILREGKPYEDQMRVIQPSELPTEIPCERVQVGRRMGYITDANETHVIRCSSGAFLAAARTRCLDSMDRILPHGNGLRGEGRGPVQGSKTTPKNGMTTTRIG